MSNEILSVLEYMEKEKGIGRPEMIETIAEAVRSAALRSVEGDREIEVKIDPKSGKLEAWVLLEVVDSVVEPSRQVHIDKARKLEPEIEIGKHLRELIDPSFLGRIAAQAARQAIMYRVRQFEKDRIYDEYKDLVGDIVSGVVRRRGRHDLIVDLGHVDGLLPVRERIGGEDYSAGDRIRCLLLKIENAPRGPEIILSRSSPALVRRLFEIEVSEISDGTVTIETIARDPGYRSKVAVRSRDTKVDPVGACVGTRGVRVKNIVRELNGEKIDIVRWHPEPLKLLEEAIKPAVPRNVTLNEQERRIHFEVAEDDMSVAIGRRGQNAKLTSKLLGWHLDIGKLKTEPKGFDDKRQEAIKTLAGRLELPVDKVGLLVDNGLSSIDAFEGVEHDDLVAMGLSEEESETALLKIAAVHSN